MYRASCMLLALKEASAETRGHQFIKFPLDRCYRSPASCHKAQAQTCRQEVTVLYLHDNRNKLVNLRFYFTISLADHDGFIYEDNESIRLLIRRGIINEETIREPRVLPGELFANIEE